MENLSDLELIAILKVYGLKHKHSETVMSIGSKAFLWFMQANNKALEAFDELILRKNIENSQTSFNQLCNI